MLPSVTLAHIELQVLREKEISEEKGVVRLIPSSTMLE